MQPRSAFEIAGHALLVAVDGHKIGALTAHKGRTPTTRLISRARALDLDDPSPQVTQHHTQEWAGQSLGQIYDQHTFQYRLRCRFPVHVSLHIHRPCVARRLPIRGSEVRAVIPLYTDLKGSVKVTYLAICPHVVI
jgi:hypothetical protein